MEKNKEDRQTAGLQNNAGTKHVKECLKTES